MKLGINQMHFITGSLDQCIPDVNSKNKDVIQKIYKEVYDRWDAF